MHMQSNMEFRRVSGGRIASLLILSLALGLTLSACSSSGGGSSSGDKQQSSTEDTAGDNTSGGDAGGGTASGSPTTAVETDGGGGSSRGGGGGGGAGGGVTVNGDTISISLPPDRSRFQPGPPMPLADATPCLACHDGGDAAEFTASTQGPNYEVVNEFCRECHSADYVSSQPLLDSTGWAKVVKKMSDRFDPAAINSYLNPEHQKLMVQYLTTVYGK